MKSVVDAVNLLLSDPHSPFVCILAIDSRIAIKSIENELGESMLRAGVTGYEYLQKIINLPFCPPSQVGAKLVLNSGNFV